MYTSFSFNSKDSVSTINLHNACIDTDALRLILYCDDGCDLLKEKTANLGCDFMIQQSSMPVHSVNDKKGIYWMSGARDVYQGSFEAIGFLLHLITNIPLYPSVRIFVSFHLDSSTNYSIFANSFL